MVTLLNVPEVKCCATCSEWCVIKLRSSESRPEDVRCPIQSDMTGFVTTKKVCGQWHSEYLNNPLANELYYHLLYGAPYPNLS